MAQSIGLYQLENLKRQQAKFMMIALTEDETAIPVHSLLKKDLIVSSGEAAVKIQAYAEAQQMPKWWPIVLISPDGSADVSVGADLAAHGFINVFSYRGGWQALQSET